MLRIGLSIVRLFISVCIMCMGLNILTKIELMEREIKELKENKRVWDREEYLMNRFPLEDGTTWIQSIDKYNKKNNRKRNKQNEKIQ